MSGPSPCWALSPLDYRAHAVIGELVDDDGTALVARCGHVMPTAAGLDAVPRASLCACCMDPDTNFSEKQLGVLFIEVAQFHG